MLLLLFGAGVVVEVLGRVTGNDERIYQVIGMDEGGS